MLKLIYSFTLFSCKIWNSDSLLIVESSTEYLFSYKKLDLTLKSPLHLLSYASLSLNISINLFKI